MIKFDQDVIKKLCGNYIDNVKSFIEKEKSPEDKKSPVPDERLMRSIEEKIDIPESRKDDFRREIMNYIGALAIEGKNFDILRPGKRIRGLEPRFLETVNGKKAKNNIQRGDGITNYE